MKNQILVQQMFEDFELGPEENLAEVISDRLNANQRLTHGNLLCIHQVIHQAPNKYVIIINELKTTE
ncbi:hypothetical protein [Paenibacillus sp. FSL W7-1287]|uniref:hypothetical protein n=1 Tax=Paenibacillus sp. FSL W7-1287 TaxID=2954538 RepID=UPI0030F99D5F